MSAEFQDDPNAPVWGAEGWSRQLESGLDEADELLIRRHLAKTPAERLRALENFVNLAVTFVAPKKLVKLKLKLKLN